MGRPKAATATRTSEQDSAIVRFNRNTTTGALTPAGCIDDNDTGADACGQTTNGLNGASSVAVSPDGKSVYAASVGDDAIVRFSRQTTGGALSLAGCIDDNDTGPELCGESTDGLNGASSVAVSPDGKSVYATSFGDAAIVRFNRNTTTGALAPRSCTDDNDTGTDACAQSVDGLDGARSVAVSADGKSVYVASDNDDAVIGFERGSFGGIAPLGCVDDNDTGAFPPQGPDACAQSTDGLDGASSVTVSADGKSVYIASQNDDAVVRLKREL